MCIDYDWYFVFFFFKQKTAYEMRISDWSSDVCSSDLVSPPATGAISRAMAGSLSSAYEAPHLNQDRAHEPSDQATVCEPAAYRFSSSAADISDDASYGSLQPAIEPLALAVAACGITRVGSHLPDGCSVAI